MGRCWGIAHGGAEPGPQVDECAAHVVQQLVVVGIGTEVCRRKCLQSIAANGLPKAVFPRTAPPGKGTAIAKVQVVRPFYMDIADVLRNIFDFRLMEQGAEGLRCCGR